MKGKGIRIEYLGLKSYNEVLAVQEKYFNALLEAKTGKGKEEAPMCLLLCQHKPVYTLGKNGKVENLLPIAKESGAEFINSSRGGDITFHGPGQLVGYPILDLERLEIGLARYIELLEESVIQVIREYGLHGQRHEGASGVWLDEKDPSRIRKICALGIRSSRWVTMHGFAFNINTDLRYFDYINPCGFQDKGVTSLAKELGEAQDFNVVMKCFVDHFLQLFGLEAESGVTLQNHDS